MKDYILLQRYDNFIWINVQQICSVEHSAYDEDKTYIYMSDGRMIETDYTSDEILNMIRNAKNMISV